VLLIIITAGLVIDDVHTVGAKSIIPFIMTRQPKKIQKLLLIELYFEVSTVYSY